MELSCFELEDKETKEQRKRILQLASKDCENIQAEIEV